MNMRRLYTLLIVWCALMIAPALLVVLGVFGRIDMNSTIPGGAAIAWVVGYLAQFAIFMWIMNVVGKQKVLWWFMASLLPWAVDWTVPVSPLFVLLWLPILIAIALWIAFVARQDESLLQQGIRATGVVLAVLQPRMNVVINNVYIRRQVRLRIEREDGAPAYEGILKGLFMLGEIPSVGDRIPVLVDPTKPQRFEYAKKEETPAPPTLARPTAASATGRANIGDQLEKLADLHERGAITDSEFDAAKKKLLRN